MEKERLTDTINAQVPPIGQSKIEIDLKIKRLLEVREGNISAKFDSNQAPTTEVIAWRSKSLQTQLMFKKCP